MRKITAILLVFAVLAALSGCTAQPSYSENTFYAMNTFITVRLSAVSESGERVSESRLAEIHDECERMVVEIENAVSVTVLDSDTARMNASETGIADASAHFITLLTRSLAITEATDGAFSPTLRVLSDLWDFNGEGYVPTADEIADALIHTDPDAVTVTESGADKIDPHLRLDFGGIAKGYAAEVLIAYLNTTELSCGLVSLGGNVGLFGEKDGGEAYKVGITNPHAPDSVLGYLTLTGGFVSVSGDYERYFEKDGVRYHHILDPKTGAPAKSGLSSVAVIAEDGALADALSTALFVMGEEAALAFYKNGGYAFEAILVTDDGRVIPTAGVEDFFALAG